MGDLKVGNGEGREERAVTRLVLCTRMYVGARMK